MSWKPASLLDCYYRLLDKIAEFEAYVNEYDSGLPIIRDTSSIHQWIERIRTKLQKNIQQEEDSMSFDE